MDLCLSACREGWGGEREGLLLLLFLLLLLLLLRVCVSIYMHVHVFCRPGIQGRRQRVLFHYTKHPIAEPQSRSPQSERCINSRVMRGGGMMILSSLRGGAGGRAVVGIVVNYQCLPAAPPANLPLDFPLRATYIHSFIRA